MREKITDTYNKLINKYHERRNDFNLDLKEKMEMDVLISLLKELKNLGPWKRMENSLIFVRHEKV